MKRTVLAIATAGLTLIGSTATAAEHVIYIMREGYFPKITYLTQGDTIRFVNTNPSYSARVRKRNGYFLTPSIGVGNYYRMSVSTFLYYNNNSYNIRPPKYIVNGSYGQYYNSSDEYWGSISFNAAPNG